MVLELPIILILLTVAGILGHTTNYGSENASARNFSAIRGVAFSTGSI